MKIKTIAQRLYLTLGSVAALFLIGLIFTIWVEDRENAGAKNIAKRNFHIAVATKQMRLDMMQMSDAMRGFLLDPKNEEEHNRKIEADDDFDKQAKNLSALLSDHPELVKTMTEVNEYDKNTLNAVENQVMDLVKTDVKAASDIYLNSYLPKRLVEVTMINGFIEKADQISMQDVAKSQTSKKLGLFIVGFIVIFAVILGRYQVKKLGEKISGFARQLDEGADMVSSASLQISGASQRLAEGASEQASSLEETSASLDEIASMVKSNAENSANASQFTSLTHKSAETGAAGAREMGQLMDGIRITSNEMREAMQRIQAASGDVSKIMKTIDEIAFQTNILALNAAVEAARAGEAGMGFAVVADEVRNLAQRSAQAARETSQMIEASIKTSEAGLIVAQKVNISFEGAAAKSAELEKLLMQILDHTKSVDERVAQIATASKEQAQGLAQVTSATGQMSKITESNAATAEESASASVELSAQAAALKENVTELSQLAGVKSENTKGGSRSPSTSKTDKKTREVHSRRKGLTGEVEAPNAPTLLTSEGRQNSSSHLVSDFENF